MDLSATIEADSTQVNADDLVEPRVVTITGVSKGTADQPVNIELAEFPGRAYRPCKSMRRVMVFAWGADASAYIGRRMEIYNDRSVKWGGQAVGGIRIKALSHIEKRLTLALTETRGKRSPFVVEPLKDAPPPAPKGPTAASIIGGFDSLGVTVEQLEAKITRPHDQWTADDIASLAAIGRAIKDGTSTTYEEFEPVAEGEQQALDGAGE